MVQHDNNAVKTSAVARKVRVAVWGLGMYGKLVVRLVKNQPDLELVAAYAYSDQKIGKDAGELVGVGNMGVAVTNNRQHLVDSRPDCVIHLVRDDADYAADDDLIFLLESGCNVITALPYCYLKRRGEVEQRIENAARRGGATFYVTGIDPDFVWERQLMTMTGLCAEIENIHIKEIFRGDTIGADMFYVFGFGKPVEEVRKSREITKFVENYLAPSMRHCCEQMGKPLDRVELSNISTPAPCDINLPQLSVKAGTVGVGYIRVEGYIGDRVFATHDIIYYLTDVTRPPEARGDECWIFSVEGRPSVRVTLEAMASVKRGTLRYDDDPDTPAGYYFCAGPVIRAIPIVVAAEPGIREPVLPEMHWTERMSMS